MEDLYTLAGSSEFELVEKKSRFIAYAFHTASEDEALEKIKEIKELHPNARHHCYAYVLYEGNRSRFSDDGEPSKTAGLPILELIKGKKLVNTLIVVVRYFGGILLGTGGLVRAYSSAAQGALEKQEFVSLQMICDFSIEVSYDKLSKLQYLLEQFDARIDEQVFEEQVSLTGRVLSDKQSHLKVKLDTLFSGNQNYRFGNPYLDSLSKQS